jgi:hypothetical protein
MDHQHQPEDDEQGGQDLEEGGQGQHHQQGGQGEEKVSRVISMHEVRVVSHDLTCNSFHETDQGRDTTTTEKETWVEGAGRDDNQRYKNFLAYCEERREEAKGMKEGDEERKRESKRKKEVWDLMREAM